MPPVAFRRRRLAAMLACLLSPLGCQPEDGSRTNPPAGAPSTLLPVPPPIDAPALCTRPGSDAVRDVFCVDPAPVIQGLSDLQRALGVSFAAADAGPSATPIGYGSTYGSAYLPSVVLLGHSTALSGELVSPLNPRAIMLGGTTFLAFNRGTQQVELASVDRDHGRVNFYLIDFLQACNASSGCTPGDLFTLRIESDWTHVEIRDDEDLKNTPSDCRQCHQRGVPSPVLLMRELNGPWTHFFGPERADESGLPEPVGSDLLDDYLGAKGYEPYAGIPSSVLRGTIGFTLQGMVNVPQPLVFDGSTIMNERWPWTEATGFAPSPVRSPTWDASYESFKRGEQLALPYFAPRATDPDKQSALSDAYQRYLSGELAAEALPDFADVFPDDPQTRAEIGLQTEPGAAPAAALVQACGTCHNDVLDQTVSRARFNIALSRLGRSELDEAIGRLRLPRGAPGSMPPPGRRQLDPGTVNPLIEYLRGSERSATDDALLEQAARDGMARPQARMP